MTSMKQWLKNVFKRDEQEEQSEIRVEAPDETTTSAERLPVNQPSSIFRDDPFFSGFPSQTVMSRALSSFFGDFDSWFGDHSPGLFQPHIDVTDSGRHLEIAAELPGMTQEDVEVQVQDNLLTLRGEKRHETRNESEGCYRLERSYGRFERQIPLPDGVNGEGAEATFDKGVLRVRMPKSKHTPKRRRIPVSSA